MMHFGGLLYDLNLFAPLAQWLDAQLVMPQRPPSRSSIELSVVLSGLTPRIRNLAFAHAFHDPYDRRMQPNMTDDKSKRGVDSRFVSGSEDYEVEYLMTKHGISKADALAAIRAAGPGREKIEQYLAAKPVKN